MTEWWTITSAIPTTATRAMKTQMFGRLGRISRCGQRDRFPKVGPRPVDGEFTAEGVLQDAPDLAEPLRSFDLGFRGANAEGSVHAPGPAVSGVCCLQIAPAPGLQQFEDNPVAGDRR